MSKELFSMDLILRGAVEQYVSDFCLRKTLEKHPKRLGNYEQQQKYHETCDAYFQTMFDEIMGSLTATLRLPGWASTKLPLEETTTLRLEATYGK